MVPDQGDLLLVDEAIDGAVDLARAVVPLAVGDVEPTTHLPQEAALAPLLVNDQVVGDSSNPRLKAGTLGDVAAGDPFARGHDAHEDLLDQILARWTIDPEADEVSAQFFAMAAV